MEGLAMAKNKTGRSSTLLWAGIAVIILLLGAGSALFYIDRGNLGAIPGVAFVRGLLGGLASTVQDAVKSDPGPAGPGVRTHMVREGENLWAIARKGKLVDSPWEWRTIVAQNRDKIDYAFISEETGAWKVILEKGQELRVKKEPPAKWEGPVEKKYTLQLMSAPGNRGADAVKIVRKVLKGGNFAYFYRVQVAGKPVYRIRAGFFDTKKQAERAGQLIHRRHASGKLFPGSFFVVVPSDRELRGELFDFGIQRTRPWVVELPRRSSHGEAMEMLKQVGSVEKFSYIAQRREKNTGLYSYRIRVGFFASEARAQAFLAGRGSGGVWGGARTVVLTDFAEALPGQSMKMKAPRT